MEATAKRLYTSKKRAIPNLAGRIEELIKENSQLRLEIAYYQNIQGPTKNLLEDVKFVVEGLEKSII
jgi:hypothetical protein